MFMFRLMPKQDQVAVGLYTIDLLPGEVVRQGKEGPAT